MTLQSLFYNTFNYAFLFVRYNCKTKNKKKTFFSYIKRRAVMTGLPPLNYVCNRCHQTGHWITQCPTVSFGLKFFLTSFCINQITSVSYILMFAKVFLNVKKFKVYIALTLFIFFILLLLFIVFHILCFLLIYFCLCFIVAQTYVIVCCNCMFKNSNVKKLTFTYIVTIKVKIILLIIKFFFICKVKHAKNNWHP